jgi:hypothetical protein
MSCGGGGLWIERLSECEVFVAWLSSEELASLPNCRSFALLKMTPWLGASRWDASNLQSFVSQMEHYATELIDPHLKREMRGRTGRPGIRAGGAICWVRFLWSLTLSSVGSPPSHISNARCAAPILIA